MLLGGLSLRMLILGRRAMSRLPALKVLPLIAVASLLFCARALAQFEVAPDHFDSAARQNTVKKKAKTERAATNHLLTDGSALATAATPRDRQSGGLSASSAARRLQFGKNVRRHPSRNHVLAERRQRRDKEESAAASR